MAELFDFTPLPIDENYKPIEGTYRNLSSGRAVVTTAGTPVQLSATPTQAKKLDVTALYENTDMVVIGGSGVIALAGTRKGVPLASGNTYTFAVTDLANVWVDSIVNGEGVSFNYYW